MIACEWSDEDSNAAVCVAHAESFAMGFDACPQTFADLQAFVKANNKEVNLCELECSMIEDQSSCDATAGCAFIDTGDINAADEKPRSVFRSPNLPPVNTGCADALALANAATRRRRRPRRRRRRRRRRHHRRPNLGPRPLRRLELPRVAHRPVRRARRFRRLGVRRSQATPSRVARGRASSDAARAAPTAPSERAYNFVNPDRRARSSIAR